jgi:hypothetical protein
MLLTNLITEYTWLLHLNIDKIILENAKPCISNKSGNSRFLRQTLQFPNIFQEIMVSREGAEP